MASWDDFSSEISDENRWDLFSRELPPDPNAGLWGDQRARSFRMVPKEEQDKPPGYFEQAVGGLKHGWDKLAYGVKDLLGQDLTPQEEEQLAQGRSFVEKTGPTSTIADIAGQLGLTAGPLGALSKGVGTGLTMLPKAGKAFEEISNIGGRV